MLVNRVAGANIKMTGTGGILSMPVRAELLDGEVILTSSWQPTPEEIDKISKGFPVYLSILSENHPPVMVYVPEEV